MPDPLPAGCGTVSGSDICQGATSFNLCRYKTEGGVRSSSAENTTLRNSSEKIWIKSSSPFQPSILGIIFLTARRGVCLNVFTLLVTLTVAVALEKSERNFFKQASTWCEIMFTLLSYLCMLCFLLRFHSLIHLISILINACLFTRVSVVMKDVVGKQDYPQG